MGLKVGDKVMGKYGRGVVKKVLNGKNVAVEFDKFMHGHSCTGYCKRGYGWWCIETSKKITNYSERDDYVYLLEASDWD